MNRIVVLVEQMLDTAIVNDGVQMTAGPETVAGTAKHEVRKMPSRRARATRNGWGTGSYAAPEAHECDARVCGLS